MSLSINQSLRKAKHHAKKGETDLAVQHYKSILEEYPQNPTAIAGLKALQQGMEVKAAINVEPSQGQISALVTLYNRGKFQEALNLGEALEKQFPSRSIVLSLLGATNAALGRLVQAVTCYTKVLETKPDDAEAHYNLGRALQELGEMDEAVTNYHKALQIKPDFVEAHYNLGVALQELGKLDEAIASYHKALTVKPDFAEVHCNLGIALQKLGKLDEAVACYHAALQIKPNFVEAHSNLGSVLQKQGKLGEAIASYHKVLQIKPDYAEVHCNLGSLLQQLGKLDKAVASYHKALQIKPDFAEAHNNLSNALMDLGRQDEAIASCHKALAVKPDYAVAHRHLSLMKKFVEYDDDIKAMEQANTRPDIGDPQRMHLSFALGKSFEDLHQYKKAFDFYLTGNTIKRGTFEYSIESVARTMEDLKELFTTEFFNRHKTTGVSDDTPVFILGMPRSGTTLVEQILASHENVYGAGELNHLSRIVASRFTGVGDAKLSESLAQASADDFSDAGREYINLIRENIDSAKFITDKMPLNFHRIGIIKLMLPRAKVIHYCRDPRDTCLSIFKNYFPADGNRYAYDLRELGQYYNLYRDLMAHWHKVLPDFIYDIHYEDIVADQEEQSRSLITHCGLEWDDACLEYYNSDRVVKTASASQVRKPMYKSSVQSWKRYEKGLAPLLDVLAN